MSEITKPPVKCIRLINYELARNLSTMMITMWSPCEIHFYLLCSINKYISQQQQKWLVATYFMVMTPKIKRELLGIQKRLVQFITYQYLFHGGCRVFLEMYWFTNHHKNWSPERYRRPAKQNQQSKSVNYDDKVVSECRVICMTWTYQKVPQKTIGMNLIARESFKKNFPRGFHQL